MKYLGNIAAIRMHHFWRNNYIKPIIVNKVNNALNDSRNNVNKKKILENENPDKGIDILDLTFRLSKTTER